MSVRLISQEELPGPLKGYRLIERLGRGGFGEVWKVEAPGGLLKAAKFVFGNLDAIDEESRPAEQEAKALERVKGIRHPYILSLEQFRVIDGQLIIVMELADRNLWDRFRECRGQGLTGIPREELIRYMEETAEALDLMNNYYQIQHLDVKPQNLFLVFNHIKVADFGLAKVLEGVKATVTGGVTPVYAAPETFEGWISRYSDQYSLAIVFQELLTGTRPFNGSNTRQLLMQHINGTPELSPLPPSDRTVIARALAKKPDDRWPNCTDMVRSLKQGMLADQATLAATPHAGETRTVRDVPRTGAQTMPSRSGQLTGDSGQVTRMAGAVVEARQRTPSPSGLPPLLKPGQSSTSGPQLRSEISPRPRLVTPGAPTAPNPAYTLNRPLVIQTGRMSSLGLAPPEKNGDGVLFPALVITLGRTGRHVAEELKQAIVDRFGSCSRTPNVRFLHIDTDVEAPLAVESTSEAATLTARETLITRLHRSTHYLQRDTLPSVEQWLPHGTLYTLSRNPVSANGVRAFGRLALIDHYRSVVQRVRQEIEVFITDGTLDHADKATQLGIRTNRPRVYVVASLAGGTGSGMFLDIAFLVRNELRQVGYLRPEVAGLFFVPPAETGTPRTPALANSYAALSELHYFQAKKGCYEAVYDKNDAPVIDREPPFAQVSLTPLPSSADAAHFRTVLASSARALYHEILTPAGRVADDRRADYRNEHPVAVPVCQLFGHYRLNWPRPEVLTAASYRLAQRELLKCAERDAAHLRGPVSEWLSRQWDERHLGFEAIVEALQNGVRTSLGEDPDRVFDAVIDPLRTYTPSGGRMDIASATGVLEQLVQVVGKPETGEPMTGALQEALAVRFNELAKETESHLAVMAATFLEVPQFRLAAAEEAVRQIGDKLKRQVDALEQVRIDLQRDVRSAFTRLYQALAGLSAGGLGAMASRKSNAAEVLEMLRVYPRRRFQLHVVELALSIFRKLLSNAPEYLRELGNCRAMLMEMHNLLVTAAPKFNEAATTSMLILPDGCKDLDDAADRFLAALAPENLLAFEQTLQKAITRKFRGLGNVCLKPNEKGPAFRELLLAKSREFLDTMLDHSNPATVFFRARTQGGTAEAILEEVYDKAAPTLTPTGTRPAELTMLAAPPGPDGERLLALTREAIPGIEFTPAPLPDDICFYREYPQVPLTALPQLAGHARDVYLLMGGDHPPHARTDICWPPPS